MQLAIFVATFFCVALTTTVLAQDDGKQFCQQLLQCKEDLQKQIADCQQQTQKQRPANATAKANKKGNCNAATQDKAAKMKELQGQQRQQVIDCLKGRVDEALPVKPKQKGKCQGSAGGANGQREKRQAAGADVNANVTATTSGEGNGNGNGKGRGRGGKGKGGHGGGRKANPCLAQVREKQAECKRLQGCCSEVGYCHLKFEISPLHDQIRQTQLEIYEARHQCQKQAPAQAQAQSSVKGAKTNNVQRDDPIADDEDDVTEFNDDED